MKHVVLTGGEPLLNRELSAICEFFRDLNLRITLLTTGLLLEKKADMVAEAFDEVILSIDGPPEVHNRIRRVPEAFQTIQRGVSRLYALHPDMQIACRTTVQKLNHAQLRATVAAARSLGLARISFLAADVSSAAFNREEGWSAERQNEIALSEKEVIALEEEIELLIQTNWEEIERGFISENAAKLRRIATRFRERVEGTPPKAPACNAPWVSAVVEVDGSVRPCFFHPRMGQLDRLTLEEAINTDAARSFRSNLQVDRNPICQRCVCSLNYPQ